MVVKDIYEIFRVYFYQYDLEIKSVVLVHTASNNPITSFCTNKMYPGDWRSSTTHFGARKKRVRCSDGSPVADEGNAEISNARAHTPRIIELVIMQEMAKLI